MAEGITLDAAQKVVAAARAKAEELGVPMSIAVVDAGNNLTAFVRMDGAWLASVEIAQNKARTARGFDMATAELAPMVEPGEPLYGLDAASGGQLIVFGGGIPLKAGDRVAGAIGASGGQVDQDVQVAEAGAGAFTG
jgi:uncharacterized protein GlcG (DUF336 family)